MDEDATRGVAPREIKYLTLLATAVSVAIGLDEGKWWFVHPAKLFTTGFTDAFAVLGVTFVANLLLSMRKWPDAKGADQLEQIAGPALRGDLSALSPELVRASRVLSAVFGGVLVGGLLGLVWRYIHAAKPL